MDTQPKPQRPFGVSLAIAACVAVFAILPLMIMLLMTYLHNRVHLPGDGSFSGLSFLGISTPAIVVYAVAAICFLVFAVFAWRGRPAAMRFIFPVVVLIMALLMSILLVVANTPNNLQQGFDSAEAARQWLREGYLVVILLIVVYVGWFFNRWSARAFFRGYYTQQDIDLINAYRQEMTSAK